MLAEGDKSRESEGETGKVIEQKRLLDSAGKQDDHPEGAL